MRSRKLPFPRLAPAEVALLVAFGLWTITPLLTLLGSTGVFNGAYGSDVPDLMQYMSFIREAGRHLLISNRFDVIHDPRLFLDPVFVISGVLWRIGVSIQAALLIWVPVVAAALFAGYRAYVARFLGGPGQRLAAMALALFLLSPVVPLLDWGNASPVLQFNTQVVSLEMFAGAYAWSGGPSLAMALVPVCLLAVERVLDPAVKGHRAAPRAAAGLAGLMASWIHPWQGLTLLGIMAALMVWGGVRKRYLPLAWPIVLTALPLAYYEVLSRTDSSWSTVSQQNGSPHFGWWLPLAILPWILAVPALLTREGSAEDMGERLLKLWVPIAAGVYLVLDRTWFYHALDSLSLPLAILSVRGWGIVRGWFTGRAWSTPRAGSVLAGAVVLAVILPGLVWSVQQLIRTREEHFFAAGEARALAYLANAPARGPVLASTLPLGEAVPAFTGRETFVGHPFWTPDYARRTLAAAALFAGTLPGPQAIALVRLSRARFLLGNCAQPSAQWVRSLGDMVTGIQRFGCATVVTVRP